MLPHLYLTIVLTIFNKPIQWKVFTCVIIFSETSRYNHCAYKLIILTRFLNSFRASFISKYNILERALNYVFKCSMLGIHYFSFMLVIHSKIIQYILSTLCFLLFFHFFLVHLPWFLQTWQITVTMWDRRVIKTRPREQSSSGIISLIGSPIIAGKLNRLIERYIAAIVMFLIYVLCQIEIVHIWSIQAARAQIISDLLALLKLEHILGLALHDKRIV